MTLWQKLVCTLITISFASSSTSVRAEFIVSIDLDPASGIQSTNSAPVNLNDEVTATIFMQMTAPSTLSAYVYSIRLGEGLEYIERSELGFGSLVGDLDQHNDFIDLTRLAPRFDAGFLGSFSTPTGPVSIGTIKFKVIGSTNLTIEPGLLDGGVFDVFADGFGNEIPANQITFNPGVVNITAVPEPSSFALLAVASLGLLVRRRFQVTRTIKAIT